MQLNVFKKIKFLTESLNKTALDWKDAKSVDGNCTKWRTVVAQCSSKNRKNEVSKFFEINVANIKIYGN